MRDGGMTLLKGGGPSEGRRASCSIGAATVGGVTVAGARAGTLPQARTHICSQTRASTYALFRYMRRVYTSSVR